MDFQRQNPADENGTVGHEGKRLAAKKKHFQPDKPYLTRRTIPASPSALRSLRIVHRSVHPSMDELWDYYSIAQKYQEASPASITLAEFQHIQRHLDACAACRERLSFVEQRVAHTKTALTQLAVPPLASAKDTSPKAVPKLRGISVLRRSAATRKVIVLAMCILFIAVVVTVKFDWTSGISNADKTSILYVTKSDVHAIQSDWRSAPQASNNEPESVDSLNFKLGMMEERFRQENYAAVMEIIQQVSAHSIDQRVALHVELYRLAAGARLISLDTATSESGQGSSETRLHHLLATSEQFALRIERDPNLEKRLRDSEDYSTYYYFLAKVYFMNGNCERAQWAASNAAVLPTPEFEPKIKALVAELATACESKQN